RDQFSRIRSYSRVSFARRSSISSRRRWVSLSCCSESESCSGSSGDAGSGDGAAAAESGGSSRTELRTSIAGDDTTSVRGHGKLFAAARTLWIVFRRSLVHNGRDNHTVTSARARAVEGPTGGDGHHFG